MDKKAQKRIDILRKKISELQPRLAGARKQMDDPDEVRKLEVERNLQLARETESRQALTVLGGEIATLTARQDQLQGTLDDGQPHIFWVMKVKGDKVLLDGNHPWAGIPLRFTVKVTGVRAASAEEIEHRHVHGEHGHHH